MSESLWQFSLHATQALLWLGLLALVWFWGWRARLERLLVLLIFLTFDLVLIGAYVRLSDAGLGCPDWPGCFAQFSPMQAQQQIAEAIAHQGHADWGPVSHAKAWKEMLHRYWASALGLLILLAWVRAWRLPLASPGAATPTRVVRLGLTLAFAAVLLQGLFGMWTVTLKLMPLVVTLHLLGAMLLLAILVATHARVQASVLPLPQAWQAPRALLALLGWALVCLTVQLALGGWTSSNYAGLACSGYPQCSGAWWPQELDATSFSAAFSLVRQLGYQSDGSLLPWPALVAIAWTHRWFAFVVLIVIWLAAWRLRHAAPRLAWLLALLPLVQMALGVANVLWQLPVLLAVAHNGVATLLFMLLVHALARFWPQPAGAAAATQARLAT